MTEAPIVSVTLLEDRAYVTRRLSVDWEVGRHSIHISDITPVLVDKTVSLKSGDSESAIMIRELKVSRLRSEEPGVDPVSLEESLTRQKQRLAQQKTALENRVQHTLDLGAQFLNELRQDVAWGRVDLEEWTSQLDLLHAGQEALDQDIFDLKERDEELQEKIQEFHASNSGVKPQPLTLRAAVEAVVEVETPYKGDLELTYCVPGACWRPYHRAEVRGNKLVFVTHATVWQNTDEDWAGVELKLSTQRSTKTTELPRLVEDELRLVDREKEVVLESREESVAHLDAQKPQTLALVPGIDDRGAGVLLTAADSVTLASHGKPQKSELFRFEVEVERKLLARPELLSQVVVQSKQSNESPHALLAGPVDLVSEGAMLGTTWLDFVAPGSSFELIWGTHKSISLRRRIDQKEEKEKLLKGWVATPVAVDLYFSNLSGEEQTVTVTERIPVSESEDLKVEYDGAKSYGTAAPNEQGFVEWVVTLGPAKREKIPIRYSISRRKSASYA